jgi:Bacterial Ig-like domain (group 3)
MALVVKTIMGGRCFGGRAGGPAVTPAVGGPAVPTGAVEFLDGGAPIASCSSQPVSAGKAKCSISYSVAGVHTIAASYRADPNFTGSTSTGHAVTVQAASKPGAPSIPPQQVIFKANGLGVIEVACGGSGAC